MSQGKAPGRIFLADSPGMRLDRFLTDRLERYSRSYVRGLIERGCVRVDGTLRGADYRLREEERVAVALPEPGWDFPDFEDWVLQEDKDLLVLNKPAGLLMHPLGRSWISAPEAALAEARPNLAGLLLRRRPVLLDSGVSRCGIVHRLDRHTSGVLLVAKSPAAQEALLADFRERRIRKLYRAIVRGSPRERYPRVSAPIGREPGHRQVRVTPLGRPAETAFRVLASRPWAALVEARPLTGRTHQIRAHLALLGHPVMGDPEFDKHGEVNLRPPRMMLHAYQIELTHPVSGRKALWRTELPKDFRDFWKLCRSGRWTASGDIL